MKRRYLAPRFVVLVLVAITVLAAYSQTRESKSEGTQKDDKTKVADRHYSTNVKELRENFNRDKGKVRLLMLLSPT